MQGVHCYFLLCCVKISCQQIICASIPIAIVYIQIVMGVLIWKFDVTLSGALAVSITDDTPGHVPVQRRFARGGTRARGARGRGTAPTLRYVYFYT